MTADSLERTLDDSLSQLQGSQAGAEVLNEPSRFRRIIKRFGLGFLAIFCLLWFTLIKLPEPKIKGWIYNFAQAQLSQKNISLSIGNSKISTFLGLSYVMTDVQLSLPNSTTPVKIEKIEFSPSILQSLLGRMGGTLTWWHNGNKLKANVWTKSTATQSLFSVHASADEFDLGRSGILPLLAGVQGSLRISGDLDLSGDLALPNTLAGEAKLKILKSTIDPQSVAGFNIPKLALTDGQIDFTVTAGKLQTKVVRLGKFGSADDLMVQLDGDITAARRVESSLLNLKAHLGVSQSVHQSFILLDALLGAGKRADGTYQFRLTGSMESPVSVPEPN